MCFGTVNIEVRWEAKLKQAALHAQADAMIGVGDRPVNHTRMRRKAVGIGVIGTCPPSVRNCVLQLDASMATFPIVSVVAGCNYLGRVARRLVVILTTAAAAAAAFRRFLDPRYPRHLRCHRNVGVRV
jgi:hypothetical protein